MTQLCLMDRAEEEKHLVQGEKRAALSWARQEHGRIDEALACTDSSHALFWSSMEVDAHRRICDWQHALSSI